MTKNERQLLGKIRRQDNHIRELEARIDDLADRFNGALGRTQRPAYTQWVNRGKTRPEVAAVVAELRTKAEELRVDGQIIIYPAELWIDAFSGKVTARVLLALALTEREQKRPPWHEPEILTSRETTFEVTP